MAIEHASVQVVRKPWGLTDLEPWSDIDGSKDAVGELWFERADSNAPIPALRLKILFTGEPLSIQVHPDDAFAHRIGLPNGKTEAWYILSATPAAQVAVGLKRHLAPQELRASIRDGSIASLVQWLRLRKATSSSSLPVQSTPSAPASCWPKFSSAATRHSVCSTMAGSAICTKTTPWPLPMPGRFEPPCHPPRRTGARTVLIASRHFILERIDLPEDSSWALLADAGDLDLRARWPRRGRVDRRIRWGGDIRRRRRTAASRSAPMD